MRGKMARVSPGLARVMRRSDGIAPITELAIGSGKSTTAGSHC
uniref:Uncharacterized protein n=1 Tax=Thermogemmatispora argillosa TaxID=2045280 RepID=A0A455T6X3_9CHLR|nr:hypothetical protein KTA_19830 [Thermogemmatispora argillosa]